MRLIFSLISILPFSVFANESISLEKGDCFKYNEFKPDNKIEWVIGRVEFLHLGTFDFNGTLYGKKKGSNQFVTFHFELPYSKRNKYPKVACPSNLPKKQK